MKLHIFNPEHEHALAADLAYFTPPHAARQLRSDLSFFPALWAENGDAVLVENIAAADSSYRKLKLARRPEVRFVTLADVPRLVLSTGEIEVKPWGWDTTLCTTLRRAGIPDNALPTVESLTAIRTLSNRALAVEILKELTTFDGTTGDSQVCETEEEIIQCLNQYGSIVVKAPWSCSGRGVRYVTKDTLTDNVRKWMGNVLRQQRSLIVERKCQKVADFAVEFRANTDGSVTPEGLSLFTTINGAYTGNLLDTEENKREMLSCYIPLELIDDVTTAVCRLLESRINGEYVGPLGIDMMIVAGDEKGEAQSFMLNPCIEINLRRTMGHAALALSRNGQRGTMNIAFENKTYKVKLTNNIL